MTGYILFYELDNINEVTMGFIVLWLNGIGIIESRVINWLVLPWTTLSMESLCGMFYKWFPRHCHWCTTSTKTVQVNITSSLQSQQTVGWTLRPHRDMFERWNLLLSQTSTSRTWLFDARTCTRPGTTGPPWRSGSTSRKMKIWEKAFVTLNINT